MGALKLFGMRAAYDEIMGVAIKRQHEPPKIVGDLLQAEISEKQARSIKYQLSVAKLALAKDIGDFDFAGTPVNESLIRDLAAGAFVADQRNVVLVGGTGTGKSHLAIAIARSLIRNGARGRFFNVVDLVNRLETETRAGRQGRIADHLTRLDFVVFDELGYLPFAQAGGQLLFHLVSKLYERTSGDRGVERPQLHPGVSQFCLNGSSRGRPAADAGQRGRGGTAVVPALCGRCNLLARMHLPLGSVIWPPRKQMAIFEHA